MVGEVNRDTETLITRVAVRKELLEKTGKVLRQGEVQIVFEKAAEIGTKKVIEEHSTIGIVMTTDGSFTDIPREDYIKAEERVVSELKALNKPFIILLNSADHGCTVPELHYIPSVSVCG